MSGYVQGTVGTDPIIEYSAIPSGGAVALKLYSSSATGWSLTRYVSQGGTLVSGTAIALPTPVPPLYGTADTQVTVLDVGDGTNAPLDGTLQYVYEFTTSTGNISTPALPVGANITLVQDDLTLILVRLLQSGFRSLAIPANFKNKPTVMHAMPIAGMPTLPIVAINQSFFGQAEVPIGQANQTNYFNNQGVITGIADRVYSVAILATTVQERDFYRDALVGIFYNILGPVLESIGQDVRHSFAIDSGQVVSEATAPGFYFAEAMLKTSGTYNVILTSDYGIMDVIMPSPTPTQDDSNGFIE